MQAASFFISESKFFPSKYYKQIKKSSQPFLIDMPSRERFYGTETSAFPNPLQSLWNLWMCKCEFLPFFLGKDAAYPFQHSHCPPGPDVRVGSLVSISFSVTNFSNFFHFRCPNATFIFYIPSWIVGQHFSTITYVAQTYSQLKALTVIGLLWLFVGAATNHQTRFTFLFVIDFKVFITITSDPLHVSAFYVASSAFVQHGGANISPFTDPMPH